VGARLDFLGALMGTVGGLETFGLLGIFIGPMIVAVGKAMLGEWAFSPPDGGLPDPGHSRTLQA
jgi:predicted PurR-regulated permease PerM